MDATPPVYETHSDMAVMHVWLESAVCIDQSHIRATAQHGIEHTMYSKKHNQLLRQRTQTPRCKQEVVSHSVWVNYGLV